MKQKCKLDKVTNIMLMIATGLLILLMLAIAAYALYWCVEAMGDPNGGGWILLIIMLLGIFSFSLILGWLIKCILFVVAEICYRKNQMIAYRVLGIIYSAMSILECICLILVWAYIFDSMLVVVLIGIIAMLVGILYFIGLLILYGFSFRMAGKKE